MKALLLFILAITTVEARAANLVRITTDQSSYTVGEKAVVYLHLDHLPNVATKELFLAVRFAGQAIKVTPLSENMAVAILPRFPASGDFVLEANVYLQDKAVQLQLAEGIAFYSQALSDLKEKLAEETDPEEKALLQAEIDRDQTLVDTLNSQATANRTLMEIDYASISVSPAAIRKPIIAGVFTLTADHDPAEYSVGQVATIQATLLTDFSGPDGARENIVRADLDGNPLVTNAIDVDHFDFSSAVFQSNDVGPRAFHAALFIRSKKQASLLRSALTAASQNLGNYQKDLALSADPARSAYDQFKINELTAVIADLNTQLDAILVPVETSTLNFTVTN